MEKIIASFFTKKPTLLFCIIMDIIGMASFLIPALGEWSDTIWAPLSAYVFYNTFGGLGGMLGGAFSFLEEIIPFTDIIPTFTLAWYLQNKLAPRTTSSVKSSKAQDIEDAEVIEIK
jgi:hypothetical protein